MTTTNPPPPKKIRSRILLLSDTHTHIPHPLPAADLLLHSGDITNLGRAREYASLLPSLKAHPAPLKLVIAGNHDITLDRAYYARIAAEESVHGSNPEDPTAIREMWVGKEAREAGVVYLEEGTSTHTLANGARVTVYSSPYQPEFWDWAFPYRRDEDRFNPPTALHTHAPQPENPVPDFPAVDIMITHGPPKGVLDETVMGEEVGCEHLRRAVTRARPLLHCFGHIHEGWGWGRMDWGKGERERVFEIGEGMRPVPLLEENGWVYLDLTGEGQGVRWGEETVFVNSSIMNSRMKPVQKPFLIDLDLPGV